MKALIAVIVLTALALVGSRRAFVPGKLPLAVQTFFTGADHEGGEHHCRYRDGQEQLLGGLALAAWETVLELMIAATGAPLGRQGRPRRPELPGDLLTEERTELLLSWRHTGFSVHNRVRVEPEDQPAVERTARYIMRPPISLERMHWSRGDQVLYRPKGCHDGRVAQQGDQAETFDSAEFLARVIMHVPDPRRHLVRYYGWYSNVAWGKRRRQDEADIDATPADGRYALSASADRDHSPDARVLRRSWAQLIKRIDGCH